MGNKQEASYYSQVALKLLGAQAYLLTYSWTFSFTVGYFLNHSWPFSLAIGYLPGAAAYLLANPSWICGSLLDLQSSVGYLSDLSRSLSNPSRLSALLLTRYNFCQRG